MLVSLLALVACKAPAADPEFSDAAAYALQNFEGEPAELAFAMRSIEAGLYGDLDLSGRLLDRSMEPARLGAADVSTFEDIPPGDPADALPVAVARLSDWGLSDQVTVQLLADHREIEPASPEQYDRSFHGGEDCFADQGCTFLRTSNDLIKDNAAMTLDYVLWKDLRWVDLGLPDPSTVAEGETPVNEGEPRWAILGRAWVKERAGGEGGGSIEQSYSLEVWLPRDGVAVEGEEGSGGGSLRMMALWTEMSWEGVDPGEDVQAGTTRSGIEGIFEAGDEWLAEAASE